METVLYRKNRIALFAEYGDPQLHKHFSKHILIADRPFVCLIEDREYMVNSMVIQSQILHSVKKDGDSRMVVFLIDETSDLSRLIDRECLQEEGCAPLQSYVEAALLECISSGCTLDEIDRCAIACLSASKADTPLLDERIIRALRYIEQSASLDQDIYQILPEQVCLSKSRFLHLFKEEVGIDMKNYLLLKRMEKVYRCVTEKHLSITEAAIMAGFSSSSHFSEACKRHYGISLTDFLKAQKL